MSVENVKPNTGQRPDQDILKDVLAYLWQDAQTRAIERSALVVEVHEQAVYLLGHVTNRTYQQRAAALAGQVAGVRAIHNRLVADPDLVTEVAQALAADPRTRLSVLGVGAFHGWIQLSGKVPDLMTRLAAEDVTARVPQVRGVLALPHLPGEHADRGENRRQLQPRAGQAVSAADGPAGLVEQVVISRHSRLVSHVVVAGTLDVSWRPIRGRWLVPMAAVAGANASGVFLLERRAELAARLAFAPADLRLPPPDWQPPFPYRAGDVAWLVEPEPEPQPLAIPVDQFLPAAWPVLNSAAV